MPMDYLSVSKTAERWGVSERSVRNYCALGRVPGAFLTGKTWSIPADAPKPLRTNGRAPHPSPLLERLREEKTSRTKGGIYHKIQVELTYNSNHIEGSRLSLDQTRQIFETATVGCQDNPINVDDIVEAANHFHAIDFVIDNAQRPLSTHMFKELHRLLKANTTDATKDWFQVGEYKSLPNEVAGRCTTLPEDVPAAIDQLLKAYNAHRLHPFEEIVAFHVAFERIHPFQDGNGRIGRLIMFKECLTNAIVPFVIEDDMKIYYYRGLAEWDTEQGFLIDTCRAAQDRFKTTLDYFRIDCNQ